MAEQVNQRIEGMINELEQMRRIELFNEEEIREISRKRKEFEYRIQRRIKQKDDFVQYIAFELALLEDISLRRKQAKIGDKRKDIEFAIAKRVNKVFKQFVMRYQDDIEIYFEYIKFCKSVGFDYAVSAMIGQMLHIHGEKPKTWQLASKWESKEKNNLETARSFLLKGIHRHPECDVLYVELFEIELKLAYHAKKGEEKEKCLKRASVVWTNGLKNVSDIHYLFKICDISMKYDDGDLTKSIKQEIWNKNDNKDVWAYIASKELEGYHWSEIEEFVEESQFSKELTYFIAVYEEALDRFPDEKLCTKYIHNLLGLNDSICTEHQKINAVKRAWMYGHENGLLSNDMYEFGLSFIKLEDVISQKEFDQILDTALTKNPKCKILWEEKLLLNKANEKTLLDILQNASKNIKGDDLVSLWNFMLDNVESNIVFKNVFKKFQSCENFTILSLKPKLLQKLYEHNGLKAAREAYEDFIKTPPTQVELHKIMVDIEMSQEKPNLKYARKCFECLIQHHGRENTDVWLDYIRFQAKNGNAQHVPQIHRRAIATLKEDLVDKFIKSQTLSRLQ